ncbi:MAG TPA: class IV adenylate cyclase [Methanothrix sp.]|nr:class IV adenylate cyclase [Methanothrix sp.]HRW82907.1 class IV adenylate cyclase [Methanothrix sp.]
MIEVEVKSRAPPGIESKIAGLGGELVGVEDHLDLYFNSQARNFRVTDEALRIRIKGAGAYLTYKGPKLDSETKSRLELTVQVADPGAMESILESIGFFRAAVVKKRRTKYSLAEAIVAVDEVEGLGTFIEVELAGGEEWGAQKRAALEILERLGINESIRKSYLELLAEVERRDAL